jgi:hypothetical protein
MEGAKKASNLARTLFSGPGMFGNRSQTPFGKADSSFKGN